MRFRKWITPPDIWSTPRPALRDLWAYATRAPWAAPTGLLRRAGKVYALLVSLPAHAVAYLLVWLVERPTRLFAVILLLVTIGH